MHAKTSFLTHQRHPRRRRLRGRAAWRTQGLDDDVHNRTLAVWQREVLLLQRPEPAGRAHPAAASLPAAAYQHCLERRLVEALGRAQPPALEPLPRRRRLLRSQPGGGLKTRLLVD